MLRLTKDCCRSRRTVVEKRDEEVFLVTQSQIFVTSPICRPNANRYRDLYIKYICFGKNCFVLGVDKTLFSALRYICFDIILREVKAFECYNITGFIKSEDTLVLLFKRMISKLVLAPLFFSRPRRLIEIEHLSCALLRTLRTTGLTGK